MKISLSQYARGRWRLDAESCDGGGLGARLVTRDQAAGFGSSGQLDGSMKFGDGSGHPMKILLLSICLFVSASAAFGQASMRIQTVTSTGGQTATLYLGELDAARIHTVKVWDGDAYDSIWFTRAEFSWEVFPDDIITGPGVLVLRSDADVNRHSVVVLERIKIIKTKGSPY
jgi:hypothetical protein